MSANDEIGITDNENRMAARTATCHNGFAFTYNEKTVWGKDSNLLWFLRNNVFSEMN